MRKITTTLGLGAYMVFGQLLAQNTYTPIQQGGGNQANVRQAGSGNTTLTTQNGAGDGSASSESNSISGTQQGINNRAQITQQTEGMGAVKGNQVMFRAASNVSDNALTVQQQSNNNAATINQQSSGNQLSLTQTGVLTGNGNRAVLNQNSQSSSSNANNWLKVTQDLNIATGGANEVTITQTGNNNRIGNNLGGAPLSSFADLTAAQQTGHSNLIRMAQNGDGNQLILSQVGNNNRLGAWSSSSLAGLPNADAAQVGNNNQASISQNGSNNLLDFKQQNISIANVANVVQTGSTNSASIAQIGSSNQNSTAANKIEVAQGQVSTGVGNDLKVTQNGADNLVRFVQTSDMLDERNSLQIEQVGNGHRIVGGATTIDESASAIQSGEGHQTLLNQQDSNQKVSIAQLGSKNKIKGVSDNEGEPEFKALQKGTEGNTAILRQEGGSNVIRIQQIGANMATIIQSLNL
jgi:hypothetical protein